MDTPFVDTAFGPAREMAAPILWALGKIAFVLQETLHAHKIPRFRRGVFWVLGEGGGSADFIVMGARNFLRGVESQMGESARF